ncbi:protein nessun dorma-like [Daphnia carinata]|uniref:protein nessun dorma-like n=1 Tax=Daphnia carinata TaxID=120202 RepID=UPI00257B08CA|nr:protein nessun dorma-like [Daphnia carinata]
MDHPIKSLQKTNILETLPDTYSCRMSAAEIVEDLKRCFNPENDFIKGQELQQIIVYYAEQAVEPVGWQALWMSDSKTSSSLKAKFKSPMLVEVNNVDYQSLEALVEIVNEMNEEKSTETVLLTELHPLKHQENDAITIEVTHNAIQRIRFFYNHLLLPWDCDVQEDWFQFHLPVRVGMFCELRSGLLNQETVVRYHYLLSEANEIEKKLQEMALKVELCDEEMEDEVVGSITELNSKLEQIQQDVEIILNPSTRMLLFGSKVTRVKQNKDPEVLLVVQDQTCISLHQTLNRLESEFSPQLNIRCYPSLQTALDDCRVDDVIVISKGIHNLYNVNSFRHGGTLIGIGAKEDIVVHPGSNIEVGLTFDDGNVVLKNFTLLVNNKQSGIAVKGNVSMENCTLRGSSLFDETKNGENDVGSWKGFYVAPQGRLVLKQTRIVSFDVGLRVRATGQVFLSSSEVESCNIGILAEQGTRIQISNCEFKHCKEYAIGVEMDSDSIGETLVGGLELLQMIPEAFHVNDCRLTENEVNVKLEY